MLKINELKTKLEQMRRSIKDELQQAHVVFALNLIKRYEDSPKDLKLPVPVEPPPGSPIGDFEYGME